MSNPKNSDNSQFARVSTSGVRQYLQTDNEGSAPLCDEYGRLIVVVPGLTPVVDPYPTENDGGAINAPFWQTSVVPSRINAIAGYLLNCPAFPAWIQFYDNLAPGAGLSVVLPMAANQQMFSYAIRKTFVIGICIAPSSTELLYTAIPGCTINVSGSWNT
jgi:hypothetical protein